MQEHFRSGNQGGNYDALHTPQIVTTDTMKLFCWVIDKSESPFSVNVANDDTVGDGNVQVVVQTPFVGEYLGHR